MAADAISVALNSALATATDMYQHEYNK